MDALPCFFEGGFLLFALTSFLLVLVFSWWLHRFALCVLVGSRLALVDRAALGLMGLVTSGLHAPFLD